MALRLKVLLPLLASVSLVSSPVLAAPQPARAATSVQQSEQLSGLGGAGVFVGVFSLTAIVLAIIIASKGGDRPNSP
jgi:hypothetical protein